MPIMGYDIRAPFGLTADAYSSLGLKWNPSSLIFA